MDLHAAAKLAPKDKAIRAVNQTHKSPITKLNSRVRVQHSAGSHPVYGEFSQLMRQFFLLWRVQALAEATTASESGMGMDRATDQSNEEIVVRDLLRRTVRQQTHQLLCLHVSCSHMTRVPVLRLGSRRPLADVTCWPTVWPSMV